MSGTYPALKPIILLMLDSGAFNERQEATITNMITLAYEIGLERGEKNVYERIAQSGTEYSEPTPLPEQDEDQVQRGIQVRQSDTLPPPIIIGGWR